MKHARIQAIAALSLLPGAGWATDAQGGTQPAAPCPPEPCWKEVSRKALELERQIAELERLLAADPVAQHPVAPPDGAEVARLEQEMADLRRLLTIRVAPAPSPNPPAPGNDENLADRVKTLESVLLLQAERDAEAKAEASRRDRALAELELRIRELEVSRRPATPEVSSPSQGPGRLMKKLQQENETLRQALRSRDQSVPQSVPSPGTSSRPAKASAPAGTSFSATLRLKRKPRLADQVNPRGPNLLGIFEYEVIDGPHAPRLIQVAHGILWNGRLTGATCRPVGATVTLDLVPLWWYPDVNRTPCLGNRASGKKATIYLPRLGSSGLEIGPALSRIRRSRGEP